MFRGLRAKAQFFRLRRLMHPGHAYLVSVACHRPGKLERGVLRPVVSADQALRMTRSWHERGAGSVDDLLASLYGSDREDDIRAFVEQGERLRRQRSGGLGQRAGSSGVDRG